MKDKTEELVVTAIILMSMIILTFIVVLSIHLHNMLIDHKCTMMTDEEFFQTEMCIPYWSYRRNK